MAIRKATQAMVSKYTLSNESIVSNGGYKVIDISRDRTTFYAVAGGTYGHTLYRSIDGGTTWTLIKTFNGFDGFSSTCAIVGWLNLPNGEQLISLSSSGSFPAKIYKSSGFVTNPVTATWILKHTMPHSQTSKSYTLNDRCLGTNGIILAGESGPQSGSLASMGLTQVSGGSGYTTATLSAAVSGGTGESLLASIYGGQVSRIGVISGGSGHTPGTYPLGIVGDGVGASWTYTVNAGGDIKGVQSTAARNLYISTDFGETWTLIFDLYTAPTLLKYGVGMHLHGCAYDEKWDRIWITMGDNTGDGSEAVGWPTTIQVFYSDDRGTTWSNLPAETYLSSQNIETQYTSIRIYDTAIVLGTDAMFGIGSIVWPRTGYRTLGTPRHCTMQQFGNTGVYLEQASAFALSNTYPAFIGVSNSGTSIPMVMATLDGYTFNEFWRETDLVTRPAIATGYVQTFQGPDTSGRVIANYNGYSSFVKGTLVIS